jgi:hypothetical protein
MKKYEKRKCVREAELSPGEPTNRKTISYIDEFIIANFMFREHCRNNDCNKPRKQLCLCNVLRKSIRMRFSFPLWNALMCVGTVSHDKNHKSKGTRMTRRSLEHYVCKTSSTPTTSGRARAEIIVSHWKRFGSGRMYLKHRSLHSIRIRVESADSAECKRRDSRNSSACNLQIYNFLRARVLEEVKVCMKPPLRRSREMLGSGAAK